MVDKRTDWTDERHRRIIEEQRRFLWTPEQVERLAAWIGFKPGDVVLDLGCGHGYIGRTFAPFVSPGGWVVGVDAEPALVAEARRRTRVAVPECQVGFDFAASDAGAVPLGDATVDVATCQTLLIHLGEPEKCLAELVRVAKPGGTVVCFEPDNFPTLAGYDSAMPYDRAEWLQFFEAGLLYHEGRKMRGRGDNNIGARVPRMMRDLGLTDIDARQNEKVWLLVPPYDTPVQRHMKEMVTSNFERRDEWREEYRGDYLAAGGDEATFERLWARGNELAARALAQIARDEYYATFGGSFFVLKGWKPA